LLELKLDGERRENETQQDGQRYRDEYLATEERDAPRRPYG
jgi:hypothetical protein